MQSILNRKDEAGIQETICKQLGEDTFSWILSVKQGKRCWSCNFVSDLVTVRDRNVDELSGGELQRFACAVVCVQQADMWVKQVNYKVTVPSYRTASIKRQRVPFAARFCRVSRDNLWTEVYSQKDIVCCKKFSYDDMLSFFILWLHRSTVFQMFSNPPSGLYIGCQSKSNFSFTSGSFMFDEPSSYLDVKQRLKCAVTIRSLSNADR